MFGRLKHFLRGTIEQLESRVGPSGQMMSIEPVPRVIGETVHVAAPAAASDSLTTAFQGMEKVGKAMVGLRRKNPPVAGELLVPKPFGQERAVSGGGEHALADAHMPADPQMINGRYFSLDRPNTQVEDLIVLPNAAREKIR